MGEKADVARPASPMFMVRLVSLMHSSRAEIVPFSLLPTRNWEQWYQPNIAEFGPALPNDRNSKTCSAWTDR